MKEERTHERNEPEEHRSKLEAKLKDWETNTFVIQEKYLFP